MQRIPHLTNRNGTYHFRRSVPKSLRPLIRKREIVLTLETKNFSEACMAALEISKELTGLFEKIQQGARLITPADQQIFASEITRLKTTSLLIEALETFEDRKPEDVEWEALHCREYGAQALEDLRSSRLQSVDYQTKELLQGLTGEVSRAVRKQLHRAAIKGLADFYANAEIIVKGDLENPLLWKQGSSETSKINESLDASDLSFETVFDQFISERELYCSDKQLNSIRAHYRYFMRFLTEEDGVLPNMRSLCSVTSRVAREFKEHLRKSPSNINKKYKHLSLRDAVTVAESDGSPTLAVTTQSKFLQHLSSLYAFAINEL